MKTFLKTIDLMTWKAVVTGGTPQIVIPNVVDTLKAEAEWTDTEDKASVGNSRALNDVFNGLDRNVFHLINTRVSTKGAWDILVVPHE